jgi:phosphohistidine phosphatase SixA
LATDPDLVRLQDHVGDQPGNSIVAMVGHSPWMEELAAILLGGSASSLRIDFPKSGVMGIELDQIEQGAGELRFYVRPKLV